MNTKALSFIAVTLLAVLTFQVSGTEFWVGEKPTVGNYGEVHSWKIDGPVFDWWIPVVDPNGNYPHNQIGVKINPDRTFGPFEIIDANYIMPKPYNEDPNRYVEVRVHAILPRYGLYKFGLDANDVKKNIGQGDFTVEYLDKEPPVFPEGGCRKGGQ